MRVRREIYEERWSGSGKVLMKPIARRGRTKRVGYNSPFHPGFPILEVQAGGGGAGGVFLQSLVEGVPLAVPAPDSLARLLEAKMVVFDPNVGQVLCGVRREYRQSNNNAREQGENEKESRRDSACVASED